MNRKLNLNWIHEQKELHNFNKLYNYLLTLTLLQLLYTIVIEV